MPSHAPQDALSTGCSRSPDATKLRLLDAAEQLFAERGFGGTSMRALAEAARTSVSAANYHFGSKRALIRAALRRRLEPLNRHRLQQLARLEAAAAPEPVRLEDLMEAFLRPSFEAWRRSERFACGRARHILAQLHADPDETITDLKCELFGPLLERYVEALARTLPDQSRSDLLLGLQLVVGALVHVLGGEVARPAEPSGSVRGRDDEMLHRMVAFATAGLRCKSLVSYSDGSNGGHR